MNVLSQIILFAVPFRNSVASISWLTAVIVRLMSTHTKTAQFALIIPVLLAVHDRMRVTA
jgi:hypothetical protein